MSEPERRAGIYALGFVVLLLASEAALSLPDESASDQFVATFMADHRGMVIVLQLVGLAAAALLGLYAVRLRQVDPVVATAGLLVALAACIPGVTTMVMAAVADPADPGAAGSINRFLPRTDDLLFVAIVAFAAAVAYRFGQAHPKLAALGAVVVVLCLVRLGLEMAGRDRGVTESLGPISFVMLVGVLGVMSWRGRLQVKAKRSPQPGL